MSTETQENEKWHPKSSKNKMFIFGLRSTTDDRPSDLSNEHRLKCKKNEESPLSHQKNKMFIFGLRSTSDDRPSNLSNEHQSKCKKMKKKAPLSHQKI